MTAIYYRDCWGFSSGGRFVLEARSPHNGGITHRDGRWATEEEFRSKYRMFQNSFRYRLLDGDGRVVWERWQRVGEESPHELVVSDDGWSVIRTHGFGPGVIVVSPAGEDVVRVRVVREGEEADEKRHGGWVPWVAKHVGDTTAGRRWAGHSWPYFFRFAGGPYFAWRTARGDRLGGYDWREAGRWRTLRITWEEGEEAGRIGSIEEVEAKKWRRIG